MRRLIDASVFEVVCFQGKSEEFCEGAKYILEMIDAQPTAFDEEKVVAELEETLRLTKEAQAIEHNINNGYGSFLQVKYSGEIKSLLYAIDRVRKGGV